MTYVKRLVSKKKRRYTEDGFDLDLSYIKPNIIAMGFPAENLEGVYRNHIDEVIRFLETKHKGHYKVYNLCTERRYDPTKFSKMVSHFPFEDHCAPPFELIKPFCKDMDQWLGSHPENVAIVHCKAGKGRTGVMICAYLLYKKYFTDAENAIVYYGDARTNNRKGVTIPSQRRYVEYFGSYIRNNWKYEKKIILLQSLSFKGIPNFNSGSCNPSFVIYQTDVTLYKSKYYEVKRSGEPPVFVLENPLPICGDIKVDFMHKQFRKERMFVFWFNTFFVERGVTSSRPDGGYKCVIRTNEDGSEVRRIIFQKQELDKANKDKKHKIFPQDFEVHLSIIVPPVAHPVIMPSMLPTNASKASSSLAPPGGQRSPHTPKSAESSGESSPSHRTSSMSEEPSASLNRSASPSLEELLVVEDLSDTDEEDINWQVTQPELHVTKV